MKDKYHFIMVNLKVISQCPRHNRLKMTKDGILTIEDSHLLVPITRYWFGDSRSKLIRDSSFLMGEIKDYIKSLLIASESNNDEKRSILAKLSGLHRELEKSITGYENLMSTYENDKLMIGELEIINENIKSMLKEIEIKLKIIQDDTDPE